MAAVDWDPADQGLWGSAVVIVDGVVELEVAGGFADAGTGVACTTGTRFPIASVSKQMAAVAVLLLAERGALTLDEPTSRWFPHATPRWRNVTINHLLSHTSGIDHWGDARGFDVFEPLGLDERLILLQRAPLHAEPGTEWRYSGPGYLLVGHIVEQAANQPYASFLADEIFTPLGLESTTAGHIPAGAARGHHDGKPLPPWDSHFPMLVGAGDVWSTAADIARFTTAVHNGSLLSQASLTTLTRPRIPVPARPAPSSNWLIADSYGYGLYLGTAAGNPAMFHTGDCPGYQSINVWLPNQAASIALLTNDETTYREHILQQLHAAILKS